VIFMPLEPLYRFTNLLLIEKHGYPLRSPFSEANIFPASIPCNDSSKFVSSFWQLLKAIVVELCAPWLSDPVIPLTSVRTVSSTSNSSLNCFSLVGAFFIDNSPNLLGHLGSRCCKRHHSRYTSDYFCHVGCSDCRGSELEAGRVGGFEIQKEVQSVAQDSIHSAPVGCAFNILHLLKAASRSNFDSKARDYFKKDHQHVVQFMAGKLEMFHWQFFCVLSALMNYLLWDVSPVLIELQSSTRSLCVRTERDPISTSPGRSLKFDLIYNPFHHIAFDRLKIKSIYCGFPTH